jgi:hypothetical protein
MKTLSTLPAALLLLFAAAVSVAQDAEPQGKWIPLFNGKDLDGWTPKITGYELGENFGNTFRVEDGVLKVAYDQYDNFGGRFGHLFYKDKFSHYLLRVEYRFTGVRLPAGRAGLFATAGSCCTVNPRKA